MRKIWILEPAAGRKRAGKIDIIKATKIVDNMLDLAPFGILAPTIDELKIIDRMRLVEIGDWCKECEENDFVEEEAKRREQAKKGEVVDEAGNTQRVIHRGNHGK